MVWPNHSNAQHCAKEHSRDRRRLQRNHEADAQPPTRGGRSGGVNAMTLQASKEVNETHSLHPPSPCAESGVGTTPSSICCYYS